MLASAAAIIVLQRNHLPMVFVDQKGQVALLEESGTRTLAKAGLEPQISPKADLLAYLEPLNADSSKLQTLNLKTKTLKTIESGNLRSPRFAPNDNRILVAAFQNQMWVPVLHDLTTQTRTALPLPDGFNPDFTSEGNIVWSTLTEVGLYDRTGKTVWKRPKPIPETAPFTWDDLYRPNPADPERAIVTYLDQSKKLTKIAVTTPKGLVVVQTGNLQTSSPTWTTDGAAVLFTGTDPQTKSNAVYKTGGDFTVIQKLVDGHSPDTP